MNLCLDDPAFASEGFRDGGGIVDIVCNTPLRHRHAITAQQFLGLIFMNIQNSSPIPMLPKAVKKYSVITVRILLTRRE